MKNHLLPNLPNNSVLVIDNASYHNVLSIKHPTSNSRKQEMKVWLRRNNISFTDSMLKDELYSLIKLHKLLHKRYKLDELLEPKGFTVLRLLPYHADLNPIELIWGQAKQFVALNNATFKLEDVKNLFEKKIADINITDWQT